MRKFLIIIPLCVLLYSCEKNQNCPEEFEFVVGTWEAYKFFTWSDSNPYYQQFPMDSIQNDFSVQISKSGISVINSGTKSSHYTISSVELISQNDSLITFSLSMYSCFPIGHKTQEIIYHIINDEIVLYSHDTNSIDGKGYSYLLKRRSL